MILCHVKLSLSEGLQHDNNIYDTNNIACVMCDVHRDFSIVVGLQSLTLSDSYLSCVCLHRSVGRFTLTEYLEISAYGAGLLRIYGSSHRIYRIFQNNIYDAGWSLRVCGASENIPIILASLSTFR